VDSSDLFCQISRHALQAGRLDLHLMPVVSEDVRDWSVLDAGEQARAERLRRARDRALFIQAHGLLRRVLSRYAPVAPAAWRFVTGRHGKPALCPRTHAAELALHFNLSHCADQVAVVVACGREVGVDIERLDALGAADDLAGLILSPAEQQGLPAAGPARQQRLLASWTFKEAVLKALGLGLGPVDPGQLVVTGDAGTGSWAVRPCAPHAVTQLASWPHGVWLHGEPVGATHHWALACPRQSADDTPTWRVLHHPAPCTTPPTPGEIGRFGHRDRIRIDLTGNP
jgi:4'-phosphopantetheinyl transferase